MKQRYALIILFLLIAMYHMGFGCATCVFNQTHDPELLKNKIYIPITAESFTYHDLSGE